MGLLGGLIKQNKSCNMLHFQTFMVNENTELLERKLTYTVENKPVLKRAKNKILSHSTAWQHPPRQVLSILFHKGNSTHTKHDLQCTCPPK